MEFRFSIARCSLAGNFVLYDQHGARRKAHHMLGDTSFEQPPEAVTAVAADHDQITLAFAG
jgi:hypothetical protein